LTEANTTDELFLQFEREAQGTADDLLSSSQNTAIDEQTLGEAFNKLLLPADHDITWLDVAPLNSTACQFERETRYLPDLLTPFKLSPKIIERTPHSMDPPYRNYTGKPYLLPQESFQLRTMARDLNRQRGVRIVSHMAWRQQVLFGRSKAKSFRLLAGKNYGNDYQINGEKHPLHHLQSDDKNGTDVVSLNEENSLIDQVSSIIQGESSTRSIDQILFESEMAVMKNGYVAEQNDIAQEQTYYPPVWEIDGLFKVYLQLLGGVPYLHVDSELNYRQPGDLPVDSELAVFQDFGSSLNEDPEAFLHSYQFKQLRRIISKQIHYFDHPAFGLIVQLRRYHPPRNSEE
jgi:hypothetical protein